MKKVLLSLLSFCAFSTMSTVYSQKACVSVVGNATFQETTPNSDCFTFSLNYVNNTGAIKNFTVEYTCNGTQISSCIAVEGKGTGTFTSTVACCDTSKLKITFLAYTSTSGCGGQVCAAFVSKGSVFEEIPTSTLPVSFKSLSATRNKSKVDVKWTTASESNNRGFNVQRNIGGTWENVAFVFSAATDGNSSSDLSYSFSDANATKGVSQYRIQQVDIDGKSRLSEIRSVKGETMASSMVVYPNPSETGKINVVFEDQSLKSVQVSDMSGRIVRSLKGVSNNVAIEGLETGVYSIQVTDLSSAAVSVEKVIIKKR